MMLLNHAHLIPEIERRIVDYKLDALVCGLGPTAHLLPWLDRKLLMPLRIWGCHDFGRIMPCHDLVIMDMPIGRLDPGHDGHKYVVNARPDRIWIHTPNSHMWKPHLHRAMDGLVQTVHWYSWQSQPANGARRDKPSLENDPPDTLLVSPTGMSTLAWREGCRRIGVIGVEMRMGEHHTVKYQKPVDQFFVQMAKQAHGAGGLIANLSPITGLQTFEKWTTSSACSSAPTTGSKEPEPSESSATASDALPLAP